MEEEIFGPVLTAYVYKVKISFQWPHSGSLLAHSGSLLAHNGSVAL